MLYSFPRNTIFGKEYNMNVNEQYINDNYERFPFYIKEYIDYRRRGGSTQFSTLKKYITKFNHFYEWNYVNAFCTSKTLSDFSLDDLSQLSKRDLESYFSSLERENIGTSEIPKYRTPETVNGYIASLKSIYNFLCNESEFDDGTPYLIANTMAKVKLGGTKETHNVRSRRISNHILNSEEEIKLFLEFIDIGYYECIKDSTMQVAYYNKYKKRDKCILYTLLYSGVRVSELCAIKEEDIDFRNGSLRVLRKGNKDDIIIINTELIDEIRSYINSKANHVKNGYIFSRDKNPNLPITDRTVRNITHKYSILFGVDMSPHKFRNTYATWLSDVSKHDISTVMSQLGHNNSDTTLLYINNNIDKVKNIVNLLNTKKEE